MPGCGENSVRMTCHECGALLTGQKTVPGCVRTCRKRDWRVPRSRMPRRSGASTRIGIPAEATASTTIIATSSEDAAHGKILPPVAHLPGEPIPADNPVEAARAENPRRFSPGDSIAAQRYKILGPLGGGGAGEVYRAHDQIMDQDVALKFLALGETGTDTTRSRFVNEVAMAREVAHPNVVRVYDIGQLANGEVFISMEFVNGEDLASLLRRAGRLSAFAGCCRCQNAWYTTHSGHSAADTATSTNQSRPP